jgi:hypothetical protein
MAEGCVAAFDADRTQLTSFKCGPGGSTPAVAQVIELEDLLRQHGGPKLADYRRYYSLFVMHDAAKSSTAISCLRRALTPEYTSAAVPIHHPLRNVGWCQRDYFCRYRRGLRSWRR